MRPNKGLIITGFFLAVILFRQGDTLCAEKNEQLSLFDKGSEEFVDYEKYGSFENTGTAEFKYIIKDKRALAKASGEGIDPSQSVKDDPEYNRLVNQGKLKGSPWKYVDSANAQLDFYKWATSYNEDPGVRLFFTAKALEKSGLYLHAIKAYYAAIILYPEAFCWNRENSWTWLIAPAAWNQIINITRMHPELEVKLEGAYIKAEHAIGNDPKNNRVYVTPGKFVKYTSSKKSSGIPALNIVERRGGKVSCVKYSDGSWGMEADGKPFFVKGLTYAPTKVGDDYNWDWMKSDENYNGVNDAAYETWVDKNANNRQDTDEPAAGDFQLLNEMGCNTIRLFDTKPLDKKLLKDLFEKYGIRVLICDMFGAYTIGSNASWQEGTDYTDPDQRQSMLDSVKAMVQEYKDEDWLLGYILGNENNMPADYSGVNATRTKADKQRQAYAEFLNEAAKMIHELDKDHPVGVGNLGLGLIEEYAQYAPELDFIGINEYPILEGFGSLWIRAKKLIDRPVLITEFGCDAYRTGKGPDEDMQSGYIKNLWQDIAYNSTGYQGEGNSIGGIVFEWIDEWWKDTRGDSQGSQSSEPTYENAFPDGYAQEEWLGITGQGDGSYSPFMRQPRKAYYALQQLWK